MSATISNGTDTVTPTTVDGFTSTRISGTLAHDIPGASWPDIVERPAGPRTGTLRLVFAGSGAESASFVAEQLHATGAALTFTPDGFASAVMTYRLAPAGRLTRELDPITRAAWVLTVDYQEAQP